MYTSQIQARELVIQEDTVCGNQAGNSTFAAVMCQQIHKINY